MLYTGKQIVKRIKSHIKNRGGAYPTWVVGVSSNARSHLFKTHGVHKKVDRWILLHAESARVARNVKAYLMDKLGIIGNKAASGEEEGADFVYAYRKSERTRP
jgi:hypothetical protein